MALRNDLGIVLRTYPFGDSHKVVILATPARGKVRCVAKGVRKTKSRFGGRLEPFTVIEAVLYEGRELDTITQVEVVDAFPRLREDLDALTIAGIMAELIDQVLFEDEPTPDLFNLLRRALAALERGHRGADLITLFFLRVADHLGLAPALDTCAACGSPDDLRFSIEAGGAICAGCAPASAEQLPTEVLGHLVAVRDDPGRTASSEWSEPGLRLMQRFLESHLERRLRTMAATHG